MISSDGFFLCRDSSHAAGPSGTFGSGAPHWWSDDDRAAFLDILKGYNIAAIPLAALGLIREDHTLYAPDLSEPLRAGDRLLLAGRESGFDILSGTLYSDSAVEYVATGRQVPSTWVWRVLTGTRLPR